MFMRSAADSKSHRKCRLYMLWSKLALPPAVPPSSGFVATPVAQLDVQPLKAKRKLKEVNEDMQLVQMVPWADS